MTEMTTHTMDLSARSARIGLIALLLARLLLGLIYSSLNPLGEAPDEADHYAYAAYIAREGRLPVGPEMTQGKHPPLSYLLAANFMRLMDAEPDTGFLRSNPDVGVTPGAAAPNFFVHTRLEAFPWPGGAQAMHLGRLVSVLAGVGLTAATYALGRRVWSSWYAGPLAAAAFVAFLPESLFIGGSMSNDMLAAMCITLAFWLGLRTGWLPAAGAGLCMGLAMTTKASTVTLWPVVALAMVVNAWQAAGHEGAKGWVRRAMAAAAPAALAGVLALLVVAPWLARNWRLYGDPFGWPLVLATIDRRQGALVLSDYLHLARGWFLSFWGKFGGAGHIPLPAPLYWIWGALLIAAGAGWAALELKQRGIPATRIAPAGWIVMVGAPLMAIVGIVSYSQTALGTDQGRLLFPALGVIGLWIAGGLSAWFPTSQLRRLPIWVGGGMAAIALLALAVGIVRPFAPPPAPSMEEAAAATPIEQQFGDDLELFTATWTEQTPPELVLYWRALRPVADDLRTAVRLVDANGNLVWEWKRSPGAGRFSTDRWQGGRLVRDTYRIPAEALASSARIEVGVRPYPEGPWLPVAGEDTLLLNLPP